MELFILYSCTELPLALEIEHTVIGRMCAELVGKIKNHSKYE